MGESAEKQATAEKQTGEASLCPKVEVYDAGPSRKTLKVEVPAEAVKAEYERYVKELARSAEAPGFRRGHVPRARLLKMFSKELTQGVKAKLVTRAMDEAFQSQKLEPVSEPVLGPSQPADAAPPEDSDEVARKYLEGLEFKPEAAFSFELSVEVKPTFELPQYKGLKLASRREPVTDEHVDRFIDAMPARRRQADYLAVEEGGAKVGDRISLGSWKLEVEGKTAAESTRAVAYLSERGLEGLPVRAPRERVEGVSAGTELALDTTVPDDFADESLRGKPARLVLRVDEVKRPHLPPLDDAAAKELGAPDAAALRRQVREQLEVKAVLDEREALEREIVDKLSEGANFDLPPGLLEREARSREIRQITRLAEMGVDPEKLPPGLVEGLRARAREDSPRSLRARLILEKIADVEKIEATDEEVEEHIYRYAMASRRTPVSVRSRLERSGQLEELKREIRLGKVLNFLIEHADKGSAPASAPASSAVGGSPSGGGAGSPAGPGQGGSA